MVSSFRRVLRALFAASLPVILGGAAHAQAPMMKFGDAALVDPASAWTYYQTQSLTSPSQTIDPLFDRTATALNDNVDEIYGFVRNEIETVPLFGVGKGAKGALIDKSGTPFDQAQLFAELVRAAGYSATYQLGTITLTGAQFNDWFGVTNTTAATEILADGGYPATVTGGTTVTSVTMMHLWVKVTIGGTVYAFDPAYKLSTPRSGSMTPSGIDTAMGLSASTLRTRFLSGATSSAPGAAVPFVTSPNRSNLRADLQTFSSQLLSSLRTNHPDSDLSGAFGGKDITRYEGAPIRQASIPYQASALSTFANDVPTAFRTLTQFTVGTDVYNWYLDEIYGDEIAFVPELEPTGPANQGGVYQYTFQRAGAVQGGVRTGVNGAAVLVINHPYAASAGAYLDRTVVVGGDLGAAQVVIGTGFSSADFGSFMEARSPATEGFVTFLHPAQGEPDSVKVGSQRATKRRAAASFISQSSEAMALLEKVGASRILIHDLVVTVDSTGLSYGGNWSPVATVLGVSTSGSFSANATNGDAADTVAVKRTAAMLMATLEGSVIEQTADSVYPISTGSRFDWASSPSSTAAQKTFYLFNSGNVGQTGSLLAQDYRLTPNEPATAAIKSSVDAYANAGFSVIVPKSSNLGPSDAETNVCRSSIVVIPATDCRITPVERGGALLALSAGGADHVIQYMGGLTRKGGGGTSDADVEPGRVFAVPEDFLETQFTARAQAGSVDLGSGTFSFSPPPDIVVGEGGYPYSLSYQRAYRSGSPYDYLARFQYEMDAISPLKTGIYEQSGWTSNFDNNAKPASELRRMFGGDSPLESTDTVAFIRVALQMSGDNADQLTFLQNQLAAIHASGWWSEQLQFNGVTISQGNDVRSYVMLADGTFRGQPGDITQVERFGTRVIRRKFTDAVARWGYGFMCVRATNPDGSVEYFGNWNSDFATCDTNAPSTGLPPRNPPKWEMRRQVFKEGVVVSRTSGSSGGFNTWTLSNNLGRSLTLTQTNEDPNSVLFNVKDNAATSRIVSFNLNVSDQIGGPGVLQVTGTDGKVWKYDGSAASNFRVFSPLSPTVPVAQLNFGNARGQAASVVDAVGNVTDYFISTGRVGAVKTPAPFSGQARALSRVLYDAFSQPIRSYDPLGRVTRTSYDAHRRTSRVDYPEGNAVTYVYDSRHNPIQTRQIAKSGSGLADIVTSATYDTLCGIPLTQVDALSRTTTTALLANRCLISSVTQPAVGGTSPVTSYTWNAFGQRLIKTDPTNRKTRSVYNGATNYLQQVIVADTTLNLTTAFGRDTAGNITSVTDPRNYVHTGEYDTSRRLTRYLGPSGTSVETKWIYDDDGRIDYVQSATGIGGTPWATTDYTYWPTSRVKEVKDADNRITQYTYDALNRPFAVIDPDNRRSETIYDIAGQVVIQKRAVGTPLAQDYQTNTFTLNGQLASVKDAKGNLTQYTYDGFDRAKRTTFPSATTAGQVNAADYEELGYDANGNVLTRRTRAGPVVTMTYDTLNRVATKAVPAFGAQASAVTTTYAYDLAGRPTSVSDTLGHALSYTSYDGAGRLETVSATGPQWSGAQAISYQYDNASNRTRLTWPGGWYASYTYDALNRMDEVRSSEGNLLLANYDYTPLSRRSLDTLGDGGTVSYGYTLAGDLTSLAQAWSGGGVNFSHTYHPDHRVATSTPSNAAFLWQPLAGGTDAFAAANGLNQYASMTPAGQGARTLTYDSLQNLTSDGITTFGFDLENRMLSASKAGMSAVYTYDPLGRRVAKSVNGVGTATLFDGDSEIGDIEGGVYVRRYVPGPGIDAPVAIREGAGWVWPRRDRLGSVIARTNASGLSGSAITYDPYGTSAQASAASGGFLFTGRRYDAETGLYYIRARMYSTELGRFLQTDPVGYADQMNLYAYVGNDPGNATDPTGREKLGLYIDTEIGVGGNVRFNAKISWDTTHNEIRVDAQVGAGVGARITGAVGGFIAPSREDGFSISADVSAQASAMASGKPVLPSVGASADVKLIGGTASSARGFEGRLMEGSTDFVAGAGPFAVTKDTATAGVGPDVGASATLNAEAGASVSFKPLVDKMNVLFGTPQGKTSGQTQSDQSQTTSTGSRLAKKPR